MSEVKHTPTPWATTGEHDGDFIIWAADDKFVANIGNAPFAPVSRDPRTDLVAFDVDEANANFIVRCVNSHEELVEALAESAALLMTLCIVANNKAIHEHLPYGLLEEVEAWLRGNKAQAALAKAGRP